MNPLFVFSRPTPNTDWIDNLSRYIEFLSDPNLWRDKHLAPSTDNWDKAMAKVFENVDLESYVKRDG